MPKMLNAKKTIFAAFMTLGLTGASLVVAQEYDPAAQPEQQQPMQTQFSDDVLKSFAAAFVKVSEITAEYAPRIEQAQELEEAVEIRQEATDAMVQVIEEEGLDPNTYNAVVNAATNDPQLGARLEKFIQQEQEAG